MFEGDGAHPPYFRRERLGREDSRAISSTGNGVFIATGAYPLLTDFHALFQDSQAVPPTTSNVGRAYHETC
jgi:hypothetical protein